MSVRYAMLALLGEGPKYGLRLREEFEARTGELWPLNVGQVYTLQRLERDGLVESDGGGDVGSQKSYRITAEGEQGLAGWLRTQPHLSSPPRDEPVMKVLVALRAPSPDVHAVIQAHWRYLVELMQQWTRIKEQRRRRRPEHPAGGRRRVVQARLGGQAAGRRRSPATDGTMTWADQASPQDKIRAPLLRRRRREVRTRR